MTLTACQPTLFDVPAPAVMAPQETYTCRRRRQLVWPREKEGTWEICNHTAPIDVNALATASPQLWGQPGQVVINCGKCALPVSVPLPAGLMICQHGEYRPGQRRA